MSLFNVFDIAGSALSAQSIRLNTIASNLANSEVVSDNPDAVYHARYPVFSTVYDGEIGAPRRGECGWTTSSRVRPRPQEPLPVIRWRMKRFYLYVQRQCGRGDGEHDFGLAFLPEQRRCDEHDQAADHAHLEPRQLSKQEMAMEATPSISGVPNTATASRTKSQGELGQEDFMRLMVAQLQNQDPTKPMDNFEFLSQIAQFGTVDGIQGLQSGFSELTSLMSSSQTLQAAGLVGHKVVTQSNLGVLAADQTLDATVTLPRNSSAVHLYIQDMSGRLVHTRTMGPPRPGRSMCSGMA